jgi:glycosyltransferase involved in cell wall biosynthesis
MQTPDPPISIVTPSYNQGHFLEETIQSVLSQNYPNLEYIVIDGGSTDNSVQIIKRYEKHLAYWVSERDRGQTDAINKGLKRSRGEFVNWINSDDRLAPGALARIAEGVAKHPQADFVYGDTDILIEDGSVLQTRPETRFNGFILRYGANVFAQPSCFFRRTLAERIHWLNEELHWSMDYDFWIRAAAAGARFAHVEGVIGQFRLQGGSKTTLQHARFRAEHYLCHRRLTLNPVLRAKPAYFALRFAARVLRVLLLYWQRGVLQPGKYSRTLKQLSAG